MKSISIIIKITLSILFLLCLFDMPYGYYQLVRYLALVGFGILAFFAKKNNNTTEMIVYCALALLFQPLLKIALGRELWNIIDILISVGLIISIFIKEKRKTDKITNAVCKKKPNKMNTEKYLDGLSEEFMSILHKYIPNSMIVGNGYSGNSFDARLSETNKPFLESQYYYKDEKKFVHWTSVQNVMSVINYRELRLYNLHNSSDADEFRYSAEKLNLNDEHIDYAKRYLYTLSFCKASEIKNPDLWQEYGKDYEGVAIEFEIINDPKDWKDFMLSQVFYEIPSHFVEMEKELELFNSKHSGASSFIDLGKLIAFHKKENFSKELEVRLSTYFPYKDLEAYEKFCNTEFKFDKGRARITDYFGLKLWVNNSSFFVKSNNPEFDRTLNVKAEYFKEKPQIKISNIYFGKNCGISNQEFPPFWKKLQYIAIIKLGYEIENLELNLYG